MTAITANSANSELEREISEAIGKEQQYEDYHTF